MEFNKQASELPEGWIWTTIDEIGIVVSGGTPSTKHPSFWNGKIPWVTPADLSNYKNVYIEKGARNISETGMEYSSAKLLPKGSILFSSRAPIGYVAIAKNDLATNQGFKNIIATESLFSEYVYYYLKTVKPLAEKMASGTTFLELSASKFAQIPIPLPPLEEQHRIVARIEELFSELNHAEEELKKAQRKLEIYKQALLKSAFEGKLTERWREENFDLGAPWGNYKLGDIVTVIRGASPRPAGDVRYFGGNIPWITVGELTKDENKTLTNVTSYLTELGKKNSRFIGKGTLLLTNSGATLGVPKISMIDGCINDGSVAFPDISDSILKNYLYWFLKSQTFWLRKISRGAGQPNLNTEIVKEMIVPFPATEEQSYIIEVVESCFSLVKELEIAIESGLLKAVVFRQSILKKAFEGRLQPQFTHEETAMELLNRIQTEKDNYLIKQKTTEKQKPRKVMPMETNKTILEVLQETNNPISPKELWLKSKHKDNIEDFYSELKEIYSLIREVKEETQSLISLKA